MNTRLRLILLAAVFAFIAPARQPCTPRLMPANQNIVCARRHTQMHKAQEPIPLTQWGVGSADLRHARGKRQRQTGQ